MRTLPLRLKNKFEGLVIDDTDSDIVDTGCTTPINGATPTECGAAEACLIPCQINYIVTICYVKRFISKLKERISWLKPKHYFVQNVAIPMIMTKGGTVALRLSYVAIHVISSSRIYI